MMNAEKIKFQFVRNGTTAEEMPEENVIWIDVGNRMGKGILDHHGNASERDDSVCAAEMVYRNQNLVLDNISDSNNLTIVGHTFPDFDCVSSAYLVAKLVQEGTLSPEMEKLVQYAKLTDTGRINPSRNDIQNPYSILAAFGYMPKNEGVPFDELNTNIMKDGFKLLDYCLERIKENPDLTFESPELIGENSPFREEIELLKSASKEYETVVASAEETQMALPQSDGIGHQSVSGIFIKDIPDNKLTRGLMKAWLRNDGYVFTFLPSYEGNSYLTNDGQVREDIKVNAVTISVAPDCGVNLRGLGKRIEKAEAIECERMDIKRYSKGRNGEISYTNRPGYDSPDPWYDGRGHGYEIIASPMSGSVLSVSEINSIVKDYSKEIAMGEQNVSQAGISLGEIRDAVENEKAKEQEH